MVVEWSPVRQATPQWGDLLDQIIGYLREVGRMRLEVTLGTQGGGGHISYRNLVVHKAATRTALPLIYQKNYIYIYISYFNG